METLITALQANQELNKRWEYMKDAILSDIARDVQWCIKNGLPDFLHFGYINPIVMHELEKLGYDVEDISAQRYETYAYRITI